MGAYVLRRLMLVVPVLLLVSLIVFTLSYHMPGDPARLHRHASAHRRQQRPDGHLGGAEQDDVVVYPTLRVGLEPFRGAAAEVRGVASGVQLPVGAEQDGGGQQGRTIEQKRANPSVRPLHHGDRGGCSQVHCEPMPTGQCHDRRA